ncbi:MAG: c-type cytochrome [Ignavibacteriae bacterium]|nr:c-type cytochrome [Ignavibacteriota bacterium]
MKSKEGHMLVQPRITHPVAALLLIQFATGCTNSWKDYQSEYQQLLSQRVPASGQSSTSEDAVGKVTTLQNDDLGISDKCSTCHLGISNSSMRRADQPFASHSGKYLDHHPAKQYGCTICHGGDGSALRENEAHAGMLRNDIVEVACTKCHSQSVLSREKLEGAPALSNGLRLLNELDCTGCHRIEGFSKLRRTAPVLTGIGSKVNRKWLFRWLKNPHAYMSNATMPTYHLADDHINALAAYLMTFTDSTTEQMNDPPSGDSEQGGNLLREARCISCHPFNGTGGHLAPDIGKIGNKVNSKWLFQMLHQPRRFQPNTTMPQFNFTAQDYSNLVAHLFEEFTDYEIKEEDEKDAKPAMADAETVDLGRRIFKELRCGNCHPYQSNQEWLQLGPVLTNIGDKKTEDINFGNSVIERTLPEYLFAKMKQPQLFVSRTNLLKMPDYHLSPQEAKDITVALLSFNAKKVRAKGYTVRTRTPPPYEPTGEFGALLEKYQCYSCHRINGRGYNLAYDLSLEGSRVQRKWLYDYLMVSYSIRPILVERMPVFRFSPHEADVLTEGIMTQFVRADIPKNLEKEFTPQMVELGKKLFDEKGCMACHIVGEKGGYVGPSFTIGAKAGDKLLAGWVYLWLKNPQAIVPDVIEPNYNLSDEEAKALTGYVMSFKSNKLTVVSAKDTEKK